MISLAILRLEVGENIFKRGEDIFNDKNIISEKTTFIVIGNKLVAKSKIKNYNLKIEFSILNGHILINDCTCPYYGNTHNKCKHIIAFSHQINNILEITIPQIVYEKPENKVKLIKENITKLNNLDASKSNTDKHIQNVTQLTKKIKNLLEKNSDLNNLEVKGEISTFSPNRSGHIYFSIKDEGAILKCVMFKWDTQNNLDFNPKTGDKVILTGSIKLYEPSGSYQLIVKKMNIAGRGDLFAKFLKLKKN